MERGQKRIYFFLLIKVIILSTEGTLSRDLIFHGADTMCVKRRSSVECHLLVKSPFGAKGSTPSSWGGAEEWQGQGGP